MNPENRIEDNEALTGNRFLFKVFREIYSNHLTGSINLRFNELPRNGTFWRTIFRYSQMNVYFRNKKFILLDDNNFYVKLFTAIEDPLTMGGESICQLTFSAYPIIESVPS